MTSTKEPVLIKEGTLKEGLTQGISLHGWTITSKKASICSSAEMEKFVLKTRETEKGKKSKLTNKY